VSGQRAGRPSTKGAVSDEWPPRRLRLPDDIGLELDDYAAGHGLTASQVVCDALREHLATRGRTPPRNG
jgi:hypothetical protein